jgi:hypothetical protein
MSEIDAVTCPICATQIQLLGDSILKYCACECLGVDSGKEYTRYIGIIPLEHPNYSQFAQEKCSIINFLKDRWKGITNS